MFRYRARQGSLKTLMFITLLVIYIISCMLYRGKENEKIKYNTERISFGLVSCRKPFEFRTIEETIVLMKSVLISAIRFKIINIDFHVFLEYQNDSTYLQQNISNFYSTKLKVNLYTYSVFDAVPKMFHRRMLFEPMFRCTFVRLFFPSSIPKHVDSIIYMDTDTIVTGNIWDLWNNLHKMNDKQLVGVVPNHLPEKPVHYKVFGCFSTPYPRPLGLNAGLMIMNLTRMREIKWRDKMLKHYVAYSRKTKLEDQILLNILTQLYPEILLRVSCRFNVRCSACEQWFLCKEAEENGIVTIHGASGQFEKEARFHFVYETFKSFDVVNADIFYDLMLLVESMPEIISKKSGIIRDRCSHPVKHLLFKTPC